MIVTRDTIGDADRRARLGGDPERGFTIWLSADEVEQLRAGYLSTLSIVEMVVLAMTVDP